MSTIAQRAAHEMALRGLNNRSPRSDYLETFFKDVNTNTRKDGFQSGLLRHQAARGRPGRPNT